jgi:methylase of polypeptide subunit release factors
MTVGNLLQNPQYKEKFVMQKLLCLFLRCTREELWTDIERQLDDGLTQKILSAYDDYVVKKKPLEYVLGYVEFF